jgi:homoserine dehydrogenase
MNTYRIAIIGFGTVGQGFAEILRDRADDLARQTGTRLVLVGVTDLVRGSVHDPAGLAPGELVDSVAATGSLERVVAPDRGWDALEMIERSTADVIVELSYTDLRTGEPALTHLRAALARDRDVVTTNKGPIALAWPELSRLADAHRREIGIEGTVMSGTPALALGREVLRAAGIRRIEGILNGTTNYVLSRMDAGLSYADALAEAQALGYAEADPTNDVEGIDAAGKLVILANVLLDGRLELADVDRRGIADIGVRDIAAAAEAGRRLKLVARVERDGDGLRASVAPTAIPIGHPLAAVSGATNAISFETDLLGQVTLTGPGAGRTETGYAVLSDLLAILRRRSIADRLPALGAPGAAAVAAGVER